MTRFLLFLINLLFALPLLGLSWAFWSYWTAPDQFTFFELSEFAVLLLVEFIVIHSSQFHHQVTFTYQPKLQKVEAFVVILVFYSAIAAGVSYAAGSSWPFYAFVGLTVLKLPTVVFSGKPDHDRRKAALTEWMFDGSLYVVGVIGSALLDIPTLGMARVSPLELNLPVEGVWFEEPHRLVAFGCFYFGVLGLKDLIVALGGLLSGAESVSAADAQ